MALNSLKCKNYCSFPLKRTIGSTNSTKPSTNPIFLGTYEFKLTESCHGEEGCEKGSFQNLYEQFTSKFWQIIQIRFVLKMKLRLVKVP